MNPLDQLGDRLLVIFDGHCGLCNGAVRWLLRHDRRDRLRFAASESPTVAGLLVRNGAGGQNPAQVPDTILAVRDPGGAEERVLVRSDAALALLGELPRPWPAVAAALGWIPRPLRNLGYRIVARCRYRIRGRLESCPLPETGQREKFL